MVKKNLLEFHTEYVIRRLKMMDIFFRKLFVHFMPNFGAASFTFKTFLCMLASNEMPVL